MNHVNLHTKFEANRASQSRDMSGQISKLFFPFFFLSFRTLRIFSHNLQMHTPIKLKLGTHTGLIKMYGRRQKKQCFVITNSRFYECEVPTKPRKHDCTTFVITYT